MGLRPLSLDGNIRMDNMIDISGVSFDYPILIFIYYNVYQIIYQKKLS